MEYKAGDLVQLRCGEQVTLVENTESNNFPLCFFKGHSVFRWLTRNGRFFLNGMDSEGDVVKLIHRTSKQTEEHIKIKNDEVDQPKLTYTWSYYSHAKSSSIPDQTKCGESKPTLQNEVLPCGLTKLEYFMAHLPNDQTTKEWLIEEKKYRNVTLESKARFQAEWKLLQAKAMLKAIEEDKQKGDSL